MAAGKALDGVGEEFFRAGESGGFVPGGKVGQREEPGSEAADRKATHADESVPCIQRTVAFVEERKMAGNVSRRFDDAQRADDAAFGKQQRGLGFDSGDTSLDFALWLVGFKGSVGWLAAEAHCVRW